ncbi:MAG: alpha-L-rhamnosidase N-terminal domain-containing protein [Kiritimatiellae bacterium]|nr:alpha-L-rhamnosidase N-terminal domain-containing protein [Kiritimatiellia bacterium]
MKSTLVPRKLRCEYLVNPLGIDVLQPRLSWIVESDENGQAQSAYQITAATSAASLAAGRPDLWDSGKVVSGETAHIPYAGRGLRGGQRVFWQVRVWDRDGNAAAASESAWFEMGLLEPSDWQAQWIIPAADCGGSKSPLFRKSFSVNKPVASARLYVCGVGIYDASLNGQPVSDQVMNRQESVLPERLLYDTFDVTALLADGCNAIGAILYPGWWGQGEIGDPVENVKLTVARDHACMLIAQLDIHYTDGSRDVIGSDASWESAESWLEPLSYFGHHYHFRGETGDGARRLALAGWDTASADVSGWAPARTVPSPTRSLAARMIEPNRVVKRLPPLSSRPIARNREWLEGMLFASWRKNWGGDVDAVYRHAREAGTAAPLPGAPFLGGVEYDFGVKTSGWYRLQVSGTKGDCISVLGLDTWRLSGAPHEEIRLCSAHRVFRHLPVLFFGKGPAPAIERVEALAIQNDLRAAGRFACSDPGLNRIHDVSMRTLATSTLRGFLMDSYRERLGTFFYNVCEDFFHGFDLGAFMTKWLADYRHLQSADGYTNSGAPIAYGYAAFSTGHMALSPLPWQMLLHYGDTRALKENYPALKSFLDFCFRQEGRFSWQGPKGDADFYAHYNRPGDECVPDLKADGRGFHSPLVGDLVDTLMLIDVLDQAIALAGIMNDPAAAAGYTERRRRLVEKANRPEFLERSRGIYGHEPASGYLYGDMGCQAMALALGIVPEEIRPRAETWLLYDIQVKRGGHHNTGFTGSYFLFRALMRMNRPDVACTLIGHPVAPSWATAVEMGDTMMNEFWGNPSAFIGSQGGSPHPGLCCAAFWFYQALGGIRPDPEKPGYQRVVIRPQIARTLDWVRAEYDSIRGTVASHWTLAGDRLTLTVTIPANVTAVVHVPADPARRVQAPEGTICRLLRRERDAAVFEVGSGAHRFESVLAPQDDRPPEIPPEPVSAFKRAWRVSNLVEEQLPGGATPKIEWTPMTFASDFIDFYSLYGLKGGTVYAEGEIEAPCDMKTLLLLGPDGPCKVWLDGKPVGEAHDVINPALPDKVQMAVALPKGRHTLTMAFDRRGGNGWGFHARFRRLDATAADQAVPVVDC